MWGAASDKLYCQSCGHAIKRKDLGPPCIYCGRNHWDTKHPKEKVTQAIAPDLKLTENDKRFLRSLRIGLD